MIVFVFADIGEVEGFSGSAEIALNLAQISSEFHWIIARNGEQFHSRDIAVGLQMGATHEAQSNDGEFHSLRPL